MLAFVFDAVGAYYVAKYIRNIWAMIGVAALVGLLSAIIAPALMFAIGSMIDGGMFRPGEAIMRAIGGVVWHPIITIGVAFVCRRLFAPA